MNDLKGVFDARELAILADFMAGGVWNLCEWSMSFVNVGKNCLAVWEKMGYNISSMAGLPTW